MAECKFCGKDDLTWKQTADGWRLHVPSGGMHQCYAFKPGRKKQEKIAAARHKARLLAEAEHHAAMLRAAGRGD